MGLLLLRPGGSCRLLQHGGLAGILGAGMGTGIAAGDLDDGAPFVQVLLGSC